MADKGDESSEAEIPESLAIGVCDCSYTATTVQRNHRFPLNLLAHIENIARMGGAPRGCRHQITKM